MHRITVYVFIATIRIIADVPLFWVFYFLYFQKEGTGGVKAAGINAVLFVTFGFLHSVLARNFSKQLIEKVVGAELVRIVHVVVSAISLSVVLFLWSPISGVVWRTQGVLYWVLTLFYLACIGGLIYTTRFIDYLEFLGLRTFLRKMKGKPTKPPVFSAKGPYAYCRHPMYLFLIGAFWLAPEMTHGRFEFAFLGTLYLIIGTYFEERNLREELSEIYERYRANVPMWIPRLTPWKYESNE
ncbi:MAG: isoprenylcysteine carboxylmethyltransferase family protein [Calditrichia bacterium]